MPQPDHTAAALPLAPILVMPLPALVRFRRLMRAEGWEVDLQRMCIDDTYAFECLAAGHCSTDAQLRHAAVGLFAAYHRNTPSPAVH
jgi:hypothetical protein